MKMKPSDFQWGPPVKHGRWFLICQKLQERPGEWAMLRVYPCRSQANAASQSLKRRRVNIPPGEFEFSTSKVLQDRGRPAGEVAVYGRALPAQPLENLDTDAG